MHFSLEKRNPGTTPYVIKVPMDSMVSPNKQSDRIFLNIVFIFDKYCFFLHIYTRYWLIICSTAPSSTMRKRSFCVYNLTWCHKFGIQLGGVTSRHVRCAPGYLHPPSHCLQELYCYRLMASCGSFYGSVIVCNAFQLLPGLRESHAFILSYMQIMASAFSAMLSTLTNGRT